MLDCDVLICGFGPVAQLLALMLGDRGISTIVVERADEPYPLPRAAVIDDEVLRIFQGVGLDDEVLADAQVQPGASIVTADGHAVEVFRSRVGRLGHPPLVSINQPSMERTLISALEDRSTVDVRWGTTLEVVDRHADHVDAYVRPSGGGHAERLSARWLVGCDGGTSAVRSRMEIPFEGRTAPQRWIVVDVLVDRPLRKVPHPHFVGSRERPSVMVPMSPGRHRWEWMLHPGEDPAPFLTFASVRERILPWLDGEEIEIERAVVYTFHTRTAARWRRGRVLLAGDAAHLTPPFAGQGFSSGARDAANLAWKLEEVLHGAPDALLDTYEQERRPHVAAMQRTANTMGAFVQATHPRTIKARDLLLRALDGTRIQDVVATNVKPLPAYGDGAFASRPARLPWRRSVGALFPQTDRLDDELPRGWAAVAIDDVARELLEEAGLTVVDPGADAAWLKQHDASWALLRPDRFVFGCGGIDAIAPTVRAWRRITAPAREAVAA